MTKQHKIKLSPTARYEWMCKEEGSFEDHGRPKTGHIFCILRDRWANGVLTLTTEDERKMVAESASYQTTWEAGESKATDTLMKEASRIARY